MKVSKYLLFLILIAFIHNIIKTNFCFFLNHTLNLRGSPLHFLWRKAESEIHAHETDLSMNTNIQQNESPTFDQFALLVTYI